MYIVDKNFHLKTEGNMNSEPDRIASKAVASSIDSTWETNEFYELEEAEVVDIILNSKHPEYKNLDDVGKVKVRRIHSERNSNKENLNWVKPLQRHITYFPVIYENVLVGEYINKNASGSIDSKESYYMAVFNVFGSVNHNAYPDVSLDKEKITKKEEESEKIERYNESEIGNEQTSGDEKTKKEYFLGETFVKDEQVHSLQPYEGDAIYQGRFGNSIRFGSTVRKDGEKINWWSSVEKNGNPILIIRNGENDDSKKLDREMLTIEDIDKDYSSIYLTSTQQIPLKRAGMGNPTWGNNSQKELTTEDYKGKQIIINSDRIVFNSKNRELLGFSKMNIGWSTENNFTVDAKKLIHFNAPEIFLGLDANKDGEPLVKGYKMVELLAEMISAILACKYNYSVVPGTEIPLLKVRVRLQDILSKKNWTQ